MLDDMQNFTNDGDWDMADSHVIPIKSINSQYAKLLTELLNDGNISQCLDIWETAHLLNISNYLDIPHIMDTLIERFVQLAGHMSDNELSAAIREDSSFWLESQ